MAILWLFLVYNRTVSIVDADLSSLFIVVRIPCGCIWLESIEV